MQRDYLELLELQTLIREGIEESLPGPLRVRAEIASMQRRTNGHCYLELCESGPRGPVAKVRAIIWRSSWEPIASKFEEASGDTLHDGISLVFEVTVSYSELYGLSLIIQDIDVAHTLGEAELARRQTVARLTEEGLMDLQKELVLPDIPYSIAVISAPDAAGYGDFCRHLQDNAYGFAFGVTLFEATMQGESAPDSIIAALDRIIACHHDRAFPCHSEQSEESDLPGSEEVSGGRRPTEGERSDIGGSFPRPLGVQGDNSLPRSGRWQEAKGFDAIFILRGGGSSLDLACFDDYGLCAAIARCPVPVYTAIGHDRDVHVADMVACGSVKTPTALADLLIDAVAAEDERISGYVSRLRVAFAGKVSAMEASCERLLHRVSLAFSGKLAVADARLAALAARIGAADPRTILSRGYALVTDGSGTVLKSASGVNAGDDISVRYSDGTLKCKVYGKV